MNVDGAFARLSEQLTGKDTRIEGGRMLHAPGLKIGGSFFAFASRGELFVKLPAGRVASLIGSGEGRPCEIRRGSPMREWVRLTPTNEATLAAYIHQARDFVAAYQRR